MSEKSDSAEQQIQFIANPTPNAVSRAGTEIRVHGVGDHAEFSALGRPGFESKRDSQVVICEPPQLPPHRLLLIGWSRANRRLTRTISWYLLFPFTLVNVAGYMAPNRQVPSQLLRASVRLVSLVLTVVLAAWVTVIVETVWRGVTSAPDNGLTRMLLCASGSTVVGTVIVKRMRNGDAAVNQAGRMCSIAHLAALALLAVTCFFGPASWEYSVDAVPPWWRSLHDTTVDPMAYLLIVSTGIVLVISLVLALIAVGIRWRAHDKWSARDGSSLAAAALLLLGATVVLHTAGSLIRLVTGVVMSVVQDLRETVAGEAVPSPHMLLPQADDLTAALRMDLLLGFFVAFAFAAGISVLAAIVVNISFGHASPPSPEDSDKRPAAVFHSILRYAPACLSYVALMTVILTLAAWGAMALRLDNMNPDAVSVARRAISVLAVVLVGFAIVRRPEKLGDWLKSIFQMVADIAGFWAPRSVPLAGASYRGILLDGLDAAVQQADDEPISLVGHSQGSVICAWYIRQIGDQQRPITLFTCGSPLWSLYSAFFPTYFGREFFELVASKSAGGNWYNYWRLTDPIATRLPAARNRDVTENKSDTLFGHSEYWRERELRDDVTAALESITAD